MSKMDEARDLAEEAKSYLLDIQIMYDGSYPNLCGGQLTVIIGESSWTFPSFCMSSGGGINPNYEGAYSGEWDISDWPDDFPENLKERVLEKINEEITMGCCGGCI